MDNIDISYAEEQGIVCQNTPEGNREAVGQHGLGLLLALLNHIARADREVKKKVWKRYKNEGVELEGQTIGIIGLGNTGEAFVRKLKGFDVNVIAYDKYRKGTSLEEVQLVKLERIYQESDIVSLHLPLTEETTYWADRPFFEAFKKNITFLNTARGKLVNTKVLVEMLKTEKVKAAALDVLENEKLDKLTPQQQYWFDYLATHPRVILTPHIAGWSKQSREKIAEMVARKAERLWKALS